MTIRSMLCISWLSALACGDAAAPELPSWTLVEERRIGSSGEGPDGFADVMILVHGGLQDKVDVKEFGLHYGRFGPGAQSVDSYQEGSLYVDVFDGKTRELIWRGSAIAQVDQVPDAAQLKATINAIISRYPN